MHQGYSFCHRKSLKFEIEVLFRQAMLYTYTKTKKLINNLKHGSKVIALDRLPNERLKRNVVRSRIDLIDKLHNVNKLPTKNNDLFNK